jgi:hypothetical protein
MLGVPDTILSSLLLLGYLLLILASLLMLVSLLLSALILNYRIRGEFKMAT